MARNMGSQRGSPLNMQLKFHFVYTAIHIYFMFAEFRVYTAIAQEY